MSTNLEAREIWFQHLEIEALEVWINKNKRICSKQFRNDVFVMNPAIKKNLILEAISILFKYQPGQSSEDK